MERRCASPSSATWAAGVSARFSARSVGRPAIRSSSCAVSLLIVASLRLVRSRVMRPTRIMKIGMSGNVIRMISADGQSAKAITVVIVGVRIAAVTSAGR